MYEIALQIRTWFDQGYQVAIATVIHTWGSAPRAVGALMAIASETKFAGSVSGGCVESAVIAKSLEILKTKRPELLHFGVSDDTAWNVGLACGGEIEVFVQPLEKTLFEEFERAIAGYRSLYFSTIIEGPPETLGSVEVIDNDSFESIGIKETPDGSSKLFFNKIIPPITLVIIGGAHIASHLAALAKSIGYFTILIDPRKAFGNQERFPEIDRVIQDWPKNAFSQFDVTDSTAIVTLTHDPKIDDPALVEALNSKAFYIGALGSCKTQTKRRKRLEDIGFSPSTIDRIFGPIGVALDAKTPQEVAVSILAQIIQVKNQGSE